MDSALKPVMRLGFIGFGNAAYDMARGLKEQGLDELLFTKHRDKPPFSGLLARRVQETGAVFKDGYAALLDGTPVIISCVVGRAALDVARKAAAHLTPQHLYVDMNTSPPAVKREMARLVEATGAAFVDATIMGAVEALRHAVPIMASGSGATQFHALFTPLGMDITVLEGEAGTAAAVKLLRSIFQKGLMALLLETLLAARYFGVQEIVLDSVARTLDNVPLRTTATRLITKGLVNAGRMTQEMEDVLATLENANLDHAMTQGTLAVYQACAALNLKDYAGSEPPQTLDAALELLLACKRKNVEDV